MNQAYPQQLKKKEEQLVKERRKEAGHWQETPSENLGDANIGVACSGGGIRSATFCLGFFQGLAKLKDRNERAISLLKSIDFLSTVSGGGYFGGFFGRLITRGEEYENKSGIEHAETVLENNHSDEITWLRNHGRYISPTGAGDTLVALAVFLRNWVTLHFVLGAGFLLLFLLANTVRAGLWNRQLENVFIGWISGTGIWWSPSIVLAIVVLLFAACPMGWAYWLAQRDPKTARSRTPLFGSAIVVLTGFYLLDIAYRRDIADIPGWEVLTVPLLFSVPIALAFLTLPLFKKMRYGRWWWIGAGIVFVVVFWSWALFLPHAWLEFFFRREARSVLALFLILIFIVYGVRLLVERKKTDESAEDSEIQAEIERKQRLVAIGLAVALVTIGAYFVFVLKGEDGKSTRDLVSEIRTNGYAIGITLVSIVAGFAFISWIIGILHAMKRTPDNPAEGVRNSLSVWLARAGAAIGVLAAFAIVDSFGQTLYASIAIGSGSLILNGMIAAVAGSAGFALFAKSIGDQLTGRKGDGKPAIRLPLGIMAGVASLVLWGSLVILYSTLSHSILWQGEVPAGNPGAELVEVWGNAQVDEIGPTSGGMFAVAPEQQGVALRPNSVPGMLLFVTLVAGLVILVSINVYFVNFSSHQRLYKARLARAYLGASNPARRTPEGKRISNNFAGDDIRFDQYAPHEEGGPLHLVNVTINETIDGRSMIEQRDRKGLQMCIGPAGMSASLGYHATWKLEEKKEHGSEKKEKGKRFEIFLDKPDQTTSRWVEIDPLPLPTNKNLSRQEGWTGFHLFRPRRESPHSELVERLTLGDWVSISGAAFSTGLGAATSRGVSSLMGFINMRLGYWWDSGIPPRKRDDSTKAGVLSTITRVLGWLLPAHTYLLDEILARFQGPNRRRWYLSDGGHFENTGCYELLRRRVPMIVVLDCGADPDYDFDDLANLVRKARIDFGAEIEFLSQLEIDRHVDPDISRYFGTPAQIRRQSRELKDEEQNELFQGRSYSKKHAALARVRYADEKEPTTEILWIKPSMVGDEPIDLRNYHGQNPKFPQESTADQFFDEAQWESYRKLGESIAKRLFYDDPRPEQSWTPLRWFEQRRKLVTFTTPKCGSTNCPHCQQVMWIDVEPMAGKSQEQEATCENCGRRTQFLVTIDDKDIVNVKQSDSG